VRSLTTVLSQSAGVDRRNVLVVAADVEAAGFDDRRGALFYKELLSRLHSVPSVEAAAVSMYPPLSGSDGAWTQNVGLDGQAPAAGADTVYFNTVSAGYFRTTGMTLIRGRDVADSDDANAPPVAVVNDALARRFFHGQDPIGRHITIGRDQSRRNLQIVGIVSDAKYQRLQEAPRSVAYLSWEQQRGGNMFVEVRTADAAAVAAAVRREVRAIDSVVPLQLQTVADRIRESLVTERALAALAALLAATAAALACAGLYGLLAYGVARQTKEIGIRLALGARRADVTARVIRECLVLTAVGVAAGLAAAVASGRFVRALLFQITPADPAAIAAAGAAMFAAALAAGLLPARRAARIDPVSALRND